MTKTKPSPGCCTTVAGPPGLRSRQRPGPAPPDGGRFQSLTQSNKDALAVVSVLFPEDRGYGDPIAEAHELVTGQSVADLREIATGAAWIAAVALRTLDREVPGLGSELLESFGLWLAEYEPPE